MIDLAKLEEAAADPRGAIIKPGMLKQIVAELTEGRAAAQRPRCFGLKPGVAL